MNMLLYVCAAELFAILEFIYYVARNFKCTSG
jgi:hypothetical protein